MRVLALLAFATATAQAVSLTTQHIAEKCKTECCQVCNGWINSCVEKSPATEADWSECTLRCGEKKSDFIDSEQCDSRPKEGPGNTYECQQEVGKKFATQAGIAKGVCTQEVKANVKAQLVNGAAAASAGTAAASDGTNNSAGSGPGGMPTESEISERLLNCWDDKMEAAIGNGQVLLHMDMSVKKAAKKSEVSEKSIAPVEGLPAAHNYDNGEDVAGDWRKEYPRNTEGYAKRDPKSVPVVAMSQRTFEWLLFTLGFVTVLLIALAVLQSKKGRA